VKANYGTVAKGVTREKLFEWFTDFSPEDVDIMKRGGIGGILSREITRDGNKIHLEQMIQVMGMRRPMSIDIVLHPEDYTYDAHLLSSMVESDLRYTFTQLPDGTRISVDGNYRLTSRALKILSILMLGLFKRGAARSFKRELRAYIAEAEEQLNSKESK